MSPSIRLTLPIPPSVNGLRTVARGRIISTNEYRSWKNAAAWEVKIGMELRPPLRGALRAAIKVPRKRTNSDPDNRIKALFDALQAGGAIENDKQFQGFVFDWIGKEHDHAIVELYEVAG